jgi:hypothetical protein
VTRARWGHGMLGRAQEGSGWHGGHGRGHGTGTGEPEGVDRDGAAQRRGLLAPASNRSRDMATNGEIGARGGCSPQEETLEHSSNNGKVGMPWVDGGGTSAACGEHR